jgi:hypothetical protein
VTGNELFPAALFGPPDRSPDAAEALAAAIAKRGDAGAYLGKEAAAAWTASWYRAVTDPGDDVRLYLMMSSSARWTAGWYRSIAVWDEQSGYGTVEASRAARGEVAGSSVDRSAPRLGAWADQWPSGDRSRTPPLPPRSTRTSGGSK